MRSTPRFLRPCQERLATDCPTVFTQACGVDYVVAVPAGTHLLADARRR